MEDKQFTQLFDLVTRCVAGVRELQQGQKILQTDVAELKADVAELKADVAEIKKDVSELKAGQSRLEKELQTTNKALDLLAGESVRTKARIDILEQKGLSN
jgi:chromosome segregation ATPase